MRKERLAGEESRLPAASTALTWKLWLLIFIFRYDDLLWPLVVAQSPAMYPVTIGLVEFIGEFFVEYDLYTAAAAMTIVPVLVIYLVLQRFIIEGIATQGLKG